jgi:hypothetical protein
MCPNCESILGPNPRPHSESKCPLKKASFCSICGKGKHVNSECTLASKLSNSAKTIQSVKVSNSPNLYIISGTKKSYSSYKDLHGLSSEEIKRIKEHLSERGFIIALPSTLPHFFIPNNNDAYKEYLKKYDLREYASVNLNRGAVRNHLEERGYILTHQDKK